MTSNNVTVWGDYRVTDHINEAKRRGLSCGVRAKEIYNSQKAEKDYMSLPLIERKAIQVILSYDKSMFKPYTGEIDGIWGMGTDRSFRSFYSLMPQALTIDIAFKSLISVAQQNGVQQEIEEYERKEQVRLEGLRTQKAELEAYLGKLQQIEKLSNQAYQQCYSSCLLSAGSNSALQNFSACGYKCTGEKYGVDLSPNWAKAITRLKQINCELGGPCD